MTFTVWDTNETGDFAMVYTEDDAELAAIEYATCMDGCDAEYRDAPHSVSVQCVDTGKITRFDVELKYGPLFSATLCTAGGGK